MRIISAIILRLLLLTGMCIITLNLFGEDQIKSPDSPDEPKVEEVQIPELKVEEVSNFENNKLYLFRVKVDLSDGTAITGTMNLTNNPIFVITNQIIGQINISTISIYQLDKIEIIKWQPERKDKDLFLFKPVEFRFYTNQTDNYISYRNPINELSDIQISNDSYGRKHIFSIFYDRWIEGKKNAFRWDNSKASVFPYNYDHPIPGVIQSITFIKN